MTTIVHAAPVTITRIWHVRILGRNITYWRRTTRVRSTYIAPRS